MSPTTTTASPKPVATEPRFEKPAEIKQVSPAGENPPAYAPANHPEFMPFR